MLMQSSSPRPAIQIMINSLQAAQRQSEYPDEAHRTIKSYSYEYKHKEAQDRPLDQRDRLDGDRLALQNAHPCKA